MKTSANLEKGEVEFLGHKLSEAGIIPRPEKVKAIQEMPRPRSIKELQKFLGMVNYYARFVGKLASRLFPLNQLLRKDTKFHWSQECQEAFEEVKEGISSTTILKFPVEGAPFAIATDATQTGIGACLEQFVDGTDDGSLFLDVFGPNSSKKI